VIELEYSWHLLTALSVGLASVHLWFPWFDARYSAHSSRWMGFIGGVATCYVVLYMLPKIGRVTTKLVGFDADAELEIGHLMMYFLLLAAIVIYLITVHLETTPSRWRLLAPAFDFSVHGAYSFLVGYVFVEASSRYADINVVIFLVLGLHLMGMNHILRTRHPAGFDRSVRWILLTLLLAGASCGLLTELPPMFMNCMASFLAGIILVNVISEELPLHHRSRVPWYLGGVAFFLSVALLRVFLDPQAAY